MLAQSQTQLRILLRWDPTFFADDGVSGVDWSPDMTTSAEISALTGDVTIPKAFLNNLAKNGDLVALRWKTDDGGWGETTFAGLAEQVARAAAGLAERGVGRGDRVMLMIRNMPSFHVLDAACLFLGATPVSIYNSSSPEQIAYLCNDAEACVAIVETQDFFDAFSAARPEIKGLKSLGTVDEVAGSDFSLGDLLASEPLDLEAAAQTAQPQDLATLIYTSGTTGPSKGVMLDHANISWTVECLRLAMDTEDFAGKRLVSYLPMAHIAERTTSHYQMMFLGYEVTCCPVPSEFAAYAGEIHPHLMFGVPRVWEKIYGAIQAALSADPEKLKAVSEAVEAATPIAEKMTFGTATKEELETYAFLDAVAFAPIRALVGLDQLDTAISGAAPIPPEILSWFRTIGVPLSEIYGLSETCGPTTWEPYRVKSGYVGVACPGIEVKLAEDGEVLCRGGNMFRGYLNQPEKTAEVMSEDGWFATGDIGEFDDEGYLKIVDRKKELIITAGGKNLSPANLEAALKMIPLVGQACAIGDQRKFVSALVVLDPDIAPQWAKDSGIEYDSMQELSQNGEVVKAIESGLREVMSAFNNAEAVKRVTILGDEWMPDTDLLTPTSKLKRRGIHAYFSTEIEAMYS